MNLCLTLIKKTYIENNSGSTSTCCSCTFCEVSAIRLIQQVWTNYTNKKTNVCLGNVPSALAPALTFIAYALKARANGSGSLNTSQVFTSLALINLVSTPASKVIGALPTVAACLGCVERIQNHLNRPYRQDQRKFIQTMTLEAVSTGNIEAIVLTGLNEQAMDLFQAYIARSDDLQTAVLAMSATNPLYVWDARWEFWRETYFDQLQHWRAFLLSDVSYTSNNV